MLSEKAKCSQVHLPAPHKHGLPHQQKVWCQQMCCCQATPGTEGGRKQVALPSLHLQGEMVALTPVQLPRAMEGGFLSGLIVFGFFPSKEPRQQEDMGNCSIWKLKPLSSQGPAMPPACQQAVPAEADGPFKSQLLQTESAQPKPRRQKYDLMGKRDFMQKRPSPAWPEETPSHGASPAAAALSLRLQSCAPPAPGRARSTHGWTSAKPHLLRCCRPHPEGRPACSLAILPFLPCFGSLLQAAAYLHHHQSASPFISHLIPPSLPKLCCCICFPAQYIQNKMYSTEMGL